MLAYFLLGLEDLLLGEGGLGEVGAGRTVLWTFYGEGEFVWTLLLRHLNVIYMIRTFVRKYIIVRTCSN
jgi:hypothetical protein